MRCYICQSIGTVQLVRCEDCSKTAQVCRVCAKSTPDELEHERARFMEEHPCTRDARVHMACAEHYLDRALADMHVARIRLEAAGFPIRAKELSERLRPLEELHAAVKVESEKVTKEPS